MPTSNQQLPQVSVLINQLAENLTLYIQEHKLHEPVLIGIHTGGAWVAAELHRKLHKNLSIQQPLGTLDISFYRDDFSTTGLNPSVKPSNLPFSPQDQHLILIDDVIMSGRTIRAALNEIFDYGRPASVTLVTLVDLSGRELPIQPDICALKLNLPPHKRLKLSGPNPLEFNLIVRPEEPQENL